MYYKSMSSVLAWDLHRSDVYQIGSCDGDAHVGAGPGAFHRRQFRGIRRKSQRSIWSITGDWEILPLQIGQEEGNDIFCS